MKTLIRIGIFTVSAALTDMAAPGLNSWRMMAVASIWIVACAIVSFIK